MNGFVQSVNHLESIIAYKHDSIHAQVSRQLACMNVGTIYLYSLQFVPLDEFTCIHRTDTKVNTDYFLRLEINTDAFIFGIYISNSTRYIRFFLKTLTCAVGSQQNMANKDISSTLINTITFAGKFCKNLSVCWIFLQTTFHQSIQYIHYYKMHLVLIWIPTLKF